MTPSLHIIAIVGIPRRELNDDEIFRMSTFIRSFFAPQLFILNKNTIFASTVFLHNESDPATFLEIIGLNTIIKTLVRNFDVEISVTAKSDVGEFTTRFLPIKHSIFHVAMIFGDLKAIPPTLERTLSQCNFLRQIRTFRNSTHMAFYATEEDTCTFNKNSSIVYSTFRLLAQPGRQIHIMSFFTRTKKIIFEDVPVF